MLCIILCMKQKDLIKKLESIGFVFFKHGGNHDIYVRDGKKEPIPRHREIPEMLAKYILKKNGYKGE